MTTKNKKAKILVLVLQALGCRVTFTDEKAVFSPVGAVNPALEKEILEHKTEILEELGTDIRLMSISGNKNAVGNELKLLINKYYPDISCDVIQTKLDEYDARGCVWCEANKNMIIREIQQFAHNNDIESTYEQTRIVVKKAISNAKKTIIS